MNHLDYVVVDLETGGLSSKEHEAISVAGKAYNGRTLEPYPIEDGGEFDSLMRPLDFDRLTDGALKVNGVTREQLKEAPDQKLVWNQFVAWVGRYNKKGTVFGAPIAGGKNLRDFDFGFIEVLNQLHCKKKDKTVLFNRRRVLELEDDLFRWFENDPDLPDLKMDTVRDYVGFSHAGAHSAIVDVRQTGELLMKFLALYRELRSRKTAEGAPFIQLRNCMRKPCTR